MYVLIIMLSWANGTSAIDQIDGFTTYANCEHVAHQIVSGSSQAIQPQVSAQCIEVK